MLEGDFADAITSIGLVPRGLRKLVLRARRQQLGIPVLADGTSPQGLWCRRHDQKRQWTATVAGGRRYRVGRAYGWDMLDKPLLH